MDDIQALRCHVADDTATIIVHAAEILGQIRGYRGPFVHDPAVRLHLLASLNQQLRRDLVDTACEACIDGYSSDQLLTILSPTPTS